LNGSLTIIVDTIGNIHGSDISTEVLERNCCCHVMNVQIWPMPTKILELNGSFTIVVDTIGNIHGTDISSKILQSKPTNMTVINVDTTMDINVIVGGSPEILELNSSLTIVVDTIGNI